MPDEYHNNSELACETDNMTTASIPVTPASAMRQLVEWSETLPLPLWQRDALRRLYATCPFSAQDEEMVFALCKNQHGLTDTGEPIPQGQPLSAAHIPSHSTSSATVTLGSISDVMHVNALADNQKVQFGSTGLTVVFGNNGSGKSGYARILKTVCRARSGEDILHNVYDKRPTTPATAKLLYYVGGSPQPIFEWKAGEPPIAALSLVSVFDSKCAPIHVDEKNEAAFTPLPLQVLKELSDVCRKIKSRLQGMSTTLAGQVPPALREIKCSRDTKAGHFLHSIDATSLVSAAQLLANVSADDLARIEKVKEQLQADPQKSVAIAESVE